MKTTHHPQPLIFQNSELYQTVFDQNIFYNTKLIILKPYDLALEYLKKVPIKILFVNLNTNVILVELKIRNQSQIAALFKYLHNLGISKQGITGILTPILSGWEQSLEDKGLEVVFYPGTHIKYHQALKKENK